MFPNKIKPQMDRINQYVNQHKIGVEIINKSCAGEFWYIVWGHDNTVILNWMEAAG